MKTFKNTIIAIAGTMLLLAMIMVNVQVGLNDGTNSDITLPGTDIVFIGSAFAQDIPGEVGDLSCDNHSNCQDGAQCNGPGKHDGPCSFDCDKGPDVNCHFEQE